MVRPGVCDYTLSRSLTENAFRVFRRCANFSRILASIVLLHLFIAPAFAQKTTNGTLKELLQRAQTSLDATNWDQAKEALQKAVALDPKSAGAHFGLARCFYHENDFIHARDSCKTAIELGFTDWRTHRFLGLCYYRLGANTEAIYSFQKCLY